ncbi:MAG: Malonyl-CoA decarboxylase [Acetobacteraceae bacterium]|nr:Malonyl-CoA decarboxylase [Acetobacteraceae bacterium]
MQTENPQGHPTLGHTSNWLERLWSSIADRGRDYANVPAASLPPADRVRHLADALLSGRGEASGAALARELVVALKALTQTDRLAFCQHVANGFTPDEANLRAAVDAWLEDPTPARAVALSDAAEPPRQELLRRMNQARGGTAALVGLRQEILGVLRAQPALAPLDSDLRHLFASWFNRGFLELRRIDWNTPAAVLEKLIAYEAVHEIEGWTDLRRRLAADRRCFAFFHPALPGEPLIFVEVALVQGLAAAVKPLLAPDTDEAAQDARARRADTAIFYSISNCQDGLRGISFGNFLIKQVVEELKAELPGISQFATLSPVPGFRRWLDRRLRQPDAPLDPAILSEAATWETPEAGAAFEAPLTRFCAQYLTETEPGRGPRDPVARFHLGNGARLERIDWRGNVSPRGLDESYGIMVNYLYDPDTIEANHEAFVSGGAVPHSAAVEALLRAPPRRRRLV